MIKKTLFILILSTAIIACKRPVTSDKLYGQWEYVKIDHPNADGLTDTISTAELKANAPYIDFSKNGKLSIVWGGKILSQGTYRISGNNINYTEQLPDGKTRTFPFWVSKLDDKNIVFETVGNDASRVTAVKRN